MAIKKRKKVFKNLCYKLQKGKITVFHSIFFKKQFFLEK